MVRFGTWSTVADIGEPGSDGIVFLSVHGSTFMPFRDTGEHTPEGLPVFGYAL